MSPIHRYDAQRLFNQLSQIHRQAEQTALAADVALNDSDPLTPAQQHELTIVQDSLTHIKAHTQQGMRATAMLLITADNDGL